jgi:putative sigma-54 modulation protein
VAGTGPVTVPGKAWWLLSLENMKNKGSEAMYVGITGRHMEVTEALRRYAEQKVRKVQKYATKVTEVLVTLSVEKYRHKAEILIRMNGSLIQATEETEEMYASIDKAMDKIERQIRKYKEKLSDHKGHPETIKHELFLGVEEQRPHHEIERRQIKVPSMTLDQALGEMGREGVECLLFNNTATGEFNVLYRRRQEGITLLEPQASIKQ